MRSTQDQHILLTTIASALNFELVSITVYSDKSFQIDGYRQDENKMLYNSDEAIDNLDINDICYYSLQHWVNMIEVFNLPKETIEQSKSQSVRDIARQNLQSKQDKFSNL